MTAKDTPVAGQVGNDRPESVMPKAEAPASPAGGASLERAKNPPFAVVKLPAPPANSKPLSAPVRLPGTMPPLATPEAATCRPPVRRASLRPRHVGLIVSFVLAVLLPVLVTIWYLWARAADQYASTLAFSVHREDPGAQLSALTGLAGFSGSASSDTDIIYGYIFSQQIVSEIQNDVDLVTMWSRPAGDPVFTFDPSGSIEDLVDYWADMVKVSYDSTTRLIEVRVLAFAPEDAQQISEAIYRKSTEMINRLNTAIQQDSLRYARDELEKSYEQLISARQAVTVFRNTNQLVDPSSDIAAQSSILASLQQELATALIDYDLVREASQDRDPRLKQMLRRIQLIEERIDAERAKIGLGSAEDPSRTMAGIVAEYERLAADREFAEAAYTSARLAYETAQAEAKRQTRYLAAHIAPTIAQASRFPERRMILAVIATFLTMAWAIATLTYYSVRDRR